MRPRTLEEFVGQEHLVGPGKVLREAVEKDDLRSLVLWGPPGTGKTTLAWILARATKARFVPFSAVLSGIAEIRKVMAEAEKMRRAGGERTVLFVDELHRFNKAQQDAFLPFVERGDIVLVGATTENPSFEVIGPLLSRSRVLVLKPLPVEAILEILRRALREPERGLGQSLTQAAEGVLERIAHFSSGDARRALNALELAHALAHPDAQGARRLTPEVVEEALQKKALLYDRAGEEHFNVISALHKSLRNSDADAALYWLARMLEAGEDPLYVARRMVRFASEDVGLAEPGALTVALNAVRAFEFLGDPEGKLALAQAAVYLALAPKSNRVYAAYGEAVKDVERTYAEPVPMHLRNPVTDLMRKTGYGEGYAYAHDVEEGVASMECMPENLKGRRYYRPSGRGLEKRLAERLAELERLRAGADPAAGGRTETPGTSGAR
ncbi:MAG TPA: replication-associated recombination protein A [Planctomycetota bacterium]|nr:replication-associated recombination protein A [Planctomycetota bacterium]